MANTTVTAMTAVTAGNLTDAAVIPLDDANEDTRKATVAQVRTQLNTGAQTFSGIVTASAGVVGNLTGNVTGNVTGTASAATLAASATVLATPRTINGTSFDGSANITVAAAAGTLTGTVLAALVVASSLTSTGVMPTLALGGNTVTASAPFLTASQTWNDGAVQFVGVTVAITDTASHAHSSILRATVGGVRTIDIVKTARVLLQYNDPNLNENGLGSAAVGNLAGALMDLNLIDGAYANAFFGNQAGHNTAKGYKLCYFGSRCGVKNINGYQNVAMGQGAAYQSTGTFDCVDIGYHAGIENLTGDSNVHIGSYAGAGASGSTARENVFVGTASGSGVTTATLNAGLGASSLLGLTGGIGNTAAGRVAGYGVSTGTYGTFLGYSAGRPATTTNQVTTASYVIYIGYQAGPSVVTQLDNATAIGKNALVGEANTMILGGTGADAIRVGIGATTVDAAALFSLTSTTQGFLPPRMTTAQVDAIGTPPNGLLVYDATLNRTKVREGGVWTRYAVDTGADATHVRLAAAAVLEVGAPAFTTSLAGSIVLAHNRGLRSANEAGDATIVMMKMATGDVLELLDASISISGGRVTTSAGLSVGANAVVGARKAGWTAATGTAERGTFATYTAPDISVGYVEAEVQAIADHLQIISRHQKAMLDDLHATAGHGLFGA